MKITNETCSLFHLPRPQQKIWHNEIYSITTLDHLPVMDLVLRLVVHRWLVVAGKTIFPLLPSIDFIHITKIYGTYRHRLTIYVVFIGWLVA